MKKLITLALVAGLAPFAFAGNGGPQLACGCYSIATAKACINIMAPVTLCSTGCFNFGWICAGMGAGDYCIDGNGHVTCANGNGGMYGGVNAAPTSCASITLSRDSRYPAIVIVAGILDGGATFCASPTALAALNTYDTTTSNQAGITSATVCLTGTLHVPANVAPGCHSGVVLVAEAYL